jgi:NadR type nicotinamide-nucleotide adenylyltransferase
LLQKQNNSSLIKRIAVIGPESTGKSTLCRQLADHFNTTWVPEYAREYLFENGCSYTYDDLLIIAQRQLASEDAHAARTSGGLLFIDTEMYVMKIWCEFVFGKTHPYILQQISERNYDLYLLCYPDLPWSKDELREYPDLEPRMKLFNMYKDNMVNQHVPWKIISGSENQRFSAAVDAVSRLYS